MASKTETARPAFDGTGARVILAELDLAITFGKIGLTSHSDSKADRNAQNAERALDAVSRMRPRLRLNQDEAKEVAAKTSARKSLLEQLKKRQIPSEVASPRD